MKKTATVSLLFTLLITALCFIVACTSCSTMRTKKESLPMSEIGGASKKDSTITLEHKYDELPVGSAPPTGGSIGNNPPPVKAESHPKHEIKEGSKPIPKGITKPGRNPASEQPSPIPITSAQPPSAPLPAKGSLAFFCPRKMLEGTASVVTATISVADIKKALENIKQIASATDNTLNTQTIEGGAEAHTIKLWQKMKIELKYSTDDFIVIDKPETEEQTFADNEVLEWNWCIEPTHIGEAQIYLAVKGYDETSNRWIAAQAPALYKIKVEIDKRTYFAKLWEYFKTNPEWLLAQVVFPVVGYVVGRRRKEA